MPTQGAGDFENRNITMSGSYEGKLPGLRLRAARVEEGLSQLTRTTVEFVSRDRMVNLDDIVGATLSLKMMTQQNKSRSFNGTCVSAEFIGRFDGYSLFVAEVRPWLWFLTRSRNCRVFQEKTTVDIIQSILGDYGFSGNLTNKVTGTQVTRDYCIQYRESDFDFLSRLMEEEGIYYFFDHSSAPEKLVLANAPGAHSPTPETPSIPFVPARQGMSVGDLKQVIFEWSAGAQVTGGKVTLSDYDFHRSKVGRSESKMIEKGTHSHKSYEVYDTPGHSFAAGRKSDDNPASNTYVGADRAQVRMEAEAAKYKVWTGTGTVRTLGVGQTFTMTDAERTNDPTKFLVAKADHYLRVEEDKDVIAVPHSLIDRCIGFPEAGAGIVEGYVCKFDVRDSSVQYRAPLVTPWPEMSGIQTAIVVGASGEEISTDKFGRVKIQFHWDRVGNSDLTSSVWVRVMMPWTGKGWGMISIPRIGQEVVVQFEAGNPDRPVIVGMLYDPQHMPPYTLPGEMTKTGIRTQSTKGGTATNYNELMFDDKINSELVNFQAEKDLKQTIKNDATITVGMEKKEPGSMSLTVYQDLTEVLKMGNHTYTVEKGNVSDTIKMGNHTYDVKMGNVTRTLDMGNESTKLSMGNYSLKADLGKITMEAMQSIELKVLGSSIKIDPTGVTIKGPMIQITADAMLQAGSPMTQVKGDGILILKGGLTMIN